MRSCIFLSHRDNSDEQDLPRPASAAFQQANQRRIGLPILLATRDLNPQADQARGATWLGSDCDAVDARQKRVNGAGHDVVVGTCHGVRCFPPPKRGPLRDEAS